MKKYLLASLAPLLLIAGCSTPGYECQLHPNSQGKCASMESAYSKSLQLTPGQSASGQSVFSSGEAKKTSAAEASDAKRPVVGAALSEMPQGDPGMPVYHQPKVVRVWVAPYVDANGNLRSGEYAYFATPGEWNYGTLRNKGQSAVFAPVKPNDYGFQSMPEPSLKAAPQSAEAPSAPPVSTPSAGAAKPAANSITQPYQRLSN